MNNISPNATNTNLPYFRKLTDVENIRFDAVDPKNGRIADIKSALIDGIEFDLEIVVDQIDEFARLCFYCTSKERTKSGDFGYTFLGNRSLKEVKQLAREIMQVAQLSKVTFEANHFDMFWF